MLINYNDDIAPVSAIVTGAFLLYAAANIDDWLPESGKPNLSALVIAFCVVSFLAATQDIVVDGWALTLLKK